MHSAPLTKHVWDVSHFNEFVRRTRRLLHLQMNLHRDTPFLKIQEHRNITHHTPNQHHTQHSPLSDCWIRPMKMEKRSETSQHSLKSGASPSSKERKTKAPKSVKLQEPQKRKEREKPDISEDGREGKDAQVISRSTVVNVDTVRERVKEEREELLGLLETEGHGEGTVSVDKNTVKHGEPMVMFNFPLQD